MEESTARQWHAFANFFPLMDQHALGELTQSIRAHGLREQIVLDTSGAIVDGRNRFLACQAAGVQPRFVTTTRSESELLAWVVDINLHRRHLTESQRAVVAARLATFGHGGARATQAAHAPLDQVTQRQAADKLGVSERSVRDGRVLLEHGPEDMLHDVEAGILAIRTAAELIRAAGKDRVLAAEYYRMRRSSRSQEWYTPKDLLHRIESFLGAIDLDPASNSHEAPWVPAKTHFTASDDGLAHAWRGRVFLNPPFDRSPRQWVQKLHDHHLAGDVPEAIALLPARTNTQWMRVLAPYPRCFLWGRLRFSDSAGEAQFPSVLIYLGGRTEAFASHFGEVGDVYAHVTSPTV
ncbi:DNA N-6-adenine-methyltransferase [Microcella sp.]|uniref:DNA N-6-adenine-methyltransferase n=1 Tax=Microcella sp. TaxID=1913979 RepID=UPI003F6F4681